MRPIDADLLAKYKYKFDIFEEVSPQTAFKEAWNNAIDTIVENAPTVDAESVKHGRWIGKSENDCAPRCSVCGRTRLGSSLAYVQQYVPYCENCGARMDESTMGQVKPSDGERKEDAETKQRSKK